MFLLLATAAPSKSAITNSAHVFLLTILSAIFFGGGAAIVVGQSATAILSGTVVDANGANVPNAVVIIRNPSVGFERRIAANADGEFVFSNLPPTNYVVEATASGFAPAQINDVALNVNDRRNLRVVLQAAGAAAVVTVEAQAREETVAVATTINQKFVENLPLNGRSFQNLIALTPGVVQTPATGFNPGQFSINGQRTTSNYFTIDGVSANFGISVDAGLSRAEDGALPALSAAGGTNSLVSVDALQEFKIQTSGYAPEFGRQPGGQVQIVTRAGSNDFTFTAFDYFRNDALDANNWFANRDGLERAALRQNDFGFVTGGPIFLPRIGEGTPFLYDGRDQTFFFVSYEGLRLRQPQFGTDIYPTAAARALAAPSARFLLDAFPLPNREDSGDGTGRFVGNFSLPSNLDAASVRIDHNFNNRLNLFGRFNYAPSSLETRGDVNTFPYALNNVTTLQTTNKTLTLGSTGIFSASVSNEVRFNLSRFDGRSISVLDTLGGAVVPADSLLFAPGTSRETGNVSIFPVDFNGFTVGANADNRQDQLNLVNNFSVAVGSHSFRFGADYRRLSPALRSPLTAQTGVFLGLFGVDQATAFGGLLSGTSFQTIVSAFEGLRLRSNNFSIYGQDTWRANRRVTLTYGLRWEYNPPPVSADAATPLRTLIGLDDLTTASLAPAGTRLFPRLNGFAPRVGASVLVNDRAGLETVVRGGAGIFYDLPLGVLSDAAINPPYRRTARLDFASFPQIASAVPPLAVQPPFDAAAGFADDLELPRTYQFNLALEQSLGANRVVSAAYVGAVGRKLFRTENVFNQNPNIARVIATRSVAESDYHALQLQFNQRLTKGLQILASHTWAHSIDTGSTNTTFLAPSAIDDLDLNRGNSDFDIRHSFNAALTYELPRLRFDSFANALLNGWAIDLLGRAQTAAPVNVFVRQATAFGNVDFRPNLIAGQPLYLEADDFPGGRRFNPAAFGFPADQQTQGTLGRNVLRGFPLRQLDLALRRRFFIGEKFNVQLRAEVFNLTNTPNFAAPNGFLGRPRNNVFSPNPFFGVSTGTFNNGLGGGGANGGQNPLYSVGGARSVQLALKLQF